MSKLDNLQNKLDMWQRTDTMYMYGSINVTLTPSDVVQLHQDAAVLYARIAELEAFIERLVEAGGKMQAWTGWSTYDEATKDWEALAKDWKEREE